MQLSILELALSGAVLTAISAVVTGIVIRTLTGTRFVSQKECAARHASDWRFDNQLMIKIDEIKDYQKTWQEAANNQNTIMFRMLRAMVVYMDIPQEQKERILNERASDS